MSNVLNPLTDIPYGRCQCGCGSVTGFAIRTTTSRGVRKGDRLRYLPGHSSRHASPRYIVDPATGCWNWQRKINPKWGYGYTSVKGRTVLAHREMYKIAVGPIPKGLQIDHQCNNPRCVNPNHMVATTPAKNSRRRRQTKLSLQIANEIRQTYKLGQVSQNQLAKRYGVAQALISRIINRTAWI